MAKRDGPNYRGVALSLTEVLVQATVEEKCDKFVLVLHDDIFPQAYSVCKFTDDTVLKQYETNPHQGLYAVCSLASVPGRFREAGFCALA